MQRYAADAAKTAKKKHCISPRSLRVAAIAAFLLRHSKKKYKRWLS
jgi:hypothetical protein